MVQEVQKKSLFVRIRKNTMLYMMLLPVLAHLILFDYLPMAGILIGFKNFIPKVGIFASEWVGFKQFSVLFSGVQFPKVLMNTISVSLLRYVFEFPAPIILALLINEISHTSVKRIVQTAVYMPHFLSWVIAGSLVMIVVDADGFVLSFLNLFGVDNTQSLLINKKAFYPIIIVSNIWKEAGWGTLIYLAAIAGVDAEQYESAILDGATRFKQMIYITLPAISSTIIVLLIMRTGSILNAGFDQIYLLQNVANADVSEVLDTYVYKMGVKEGKYSLATAVGLFKSIIGMILVLTTNAIARRMGESSLL